MNSTFHHIRPNRSSLMTIALFVLLAVLSTQSLPPARAEQAQVGRSDPVPAAPGTDFYSTFDVTSAGWGSATGTWTLVRHAYYKCTGCPPGVVSSIYHDGTYANMIYKANMRKPGFCSTRCGDMGLIVRGDPTRLGTWRDWQPEYWFAYANSGYWHVLYWDGSGTYTILKNWTYSPIIQRGGWNTLKVTATGPKLRFSINGVHVWSRFDYALTTGQVGIGYYQGPDAGALKVNWAKLTTLITDVTGPGLDEVLDTGTPLIGFPDEAMHQSP